MHNEVVPLGLIQKPTQQKPVYFVALCLAQVLDEVFRIVPAKIIRIFMVQKINMEGKAEMS